MSVFNISAYLYTGADGRLINVLSVFLHPVTFSEELLDEAVVPWLASGGPYDRVHITGQPSALATARAILARESAIRIRLQKMLKEIDHITFITWSTSHATISAESLNGTSLTEANVDALEQRFSLFDLFLRNGGLVSASRGTHFTKPSGTHSTQFLRAANVLEKSGATHQLLFWLYPLVKGRPIKRIVVDTSGIAPVAHALAYERIRCQETDTLPVIESHASYGGLDALTVSDPANTIFLISASTSGSLASKLIEKGAEEENIFTLFFLGPTTPGTIICNLGEDIENSFKGMPRIANYSAVKCPECRNHSYAIPIVGDQFRTEPAKVEEIEVALGDFDETSRLVLDQLVSTGLFKAFRSVGTRQFELYLDVQNMLEGTAEEESARDRIANMRTKLSRLIRRGSTVNLRRIVPTSYPGARTLADQTHAALPPDLREQSIVTSSVALSTASEEREAGTLVLSGCMDDTYELMGISRDLRSVHPGGSITYVSPIFRAASGSERRRIESNLTFGDQGPKSFTLLSIVSVDLPNCAPDHSWQLEYERLLDLEYWCTYTDRDVPTAITERIETLRTAPGIGLENNLFWPSPQGVTLKLAADFTMIPTYDGKRIISQADTFAIITSLFHKYRQGVPKKPRLICRTYERTVISPESFQRFSDGVIQASFLRAAREGEIAYSNCDEIVSERMFAFLAGEVSAARQNGGHALMEYLVALLIDRLTLHQKHTRELLTMIVENAIGDHLTIVATFLISEMEQTRQTDLSA